MNPSAALTPDDIAGLDFDKGGGLLPAIVQHADNRAVLMLGYMTREALTETLRRGRVVFFSRSRGALWEKGETSGHTLMVRRVVADCADDTVLIDAIPAGPTCHRQTPTCFGDGAWPAPAAFPFLAKLQGVIAERIAQRPEGSYTSKLLAAGPRRMAQKVGEEGVEVALAATSGTDAELVSESADLLYHLTLVLKARGLGLEDVERELERRHEGATVPR